jgi:predicted phage terminase large subunit-like protein
MVTPDEYAALISVDQQAFTEECFLQVSPADKYQHNWHIDCIIEHLAAVEAGELKRLLIMMPPREMKSITITIAWTAWLLGHHPDWRIICASYGDALAKRQSIDTRLVVESEVYKKAFPSTRLASDQNEKGMFMTTRRGSRKATSVGGQILGDGGDCFPAGTLILTTKGYVPIEKLGCVGTDFLVPSYNHETGMIENKRVEAWREKETTGLFELRTVQGHKVKCTSDHRFFVVGRGYVPARSIRKGDNVYICDSLRNVREECREASLSGQEGHQSKKPRCLLLNPVQEYSSQFQKQPRLPLVQTEKSSSWKKVLFSFMQERTYKFFEACYPVQALFKGLQSKKLLQSILLYNLQKRSAFKKNDGREQQQVSRRMELQATVFCNETFNPGAGWARLFGLPINNKVGDSSHGREQAQQYSRESYNALPQLPHEPSQVKSVAVSSVKQVSRAKTKVYDIQVEGNHNFFANEILAHNCLIFDDLLKADEAPSDTVRNSTNAWLDQSFLTRANNPATARIVGVAQRLHMDDPMGHLMERGGWHTLILPAEFKQKTMIEVRGKVWEKEPGDLFNPSRLGREILDQKLRDLGPTAYAGQYMQNPIPAEGGMFKGHWLQHHDVTSWRGMNGYILCDPANSKKERSGHDPDWTVFFVVGLAADNNYYVADIVRDRFNPAERVDMLMKLHRKWNRAFGKPPKVGVEQYGMMTDAFFIKQRQGQDNYRFPITELGGTMRKEDRVRMLVTPFSEGRVYLPKSLPYQTLAGERLDLVRELIAEYDTFPLGRHDDIMDAFARILDPKMNAIFPMVRDDVEVYRAGQAHSGDYDPNDIRTW